MPREIIVLGTFLHRNLSVKRIIRPRPSPAPGPRSLRISKSSSDDALDHYPTIYASKNISVVDEPQNIVTEEKEKKVGCSQRERSMVLSHQGS